jgi:hypothetical protein
MDKKASLFKYETFTVRRAKCIEAHDLPRKQDR